MRDLSLAFAIKLFIDILGEFDLSTWRSLKIRINFIIHLRLSIISCGKNSFWSRIVWIFYLIVNHWIKKPYKIKNYEIYNFYFVAVCKCWSVWIETFKSRKEKLKYLWQANFTETRESSWWSTNYSRFFSMVSSTSGQKAVRKNVMFINLYFVITSNLWHLQECCINY